MNCIMVKSRKLIEYVNNNMTLKLTEKTSAIYLLTNFNINCEEESKGKLIKIGTLLGLLGFFQLILKTVFIINYQITGKFQ